MSIVKAIVFLSELQLTVLNDAKFRLEEAFLVSVMGSLVEIPSGFETDFASVPRLPIVYLTLGNKGHKAAVLHDWLYATNLYPRAKCDYYFYLALRESGIGYIAAKAMYLGVRVGGGSIYDFYTEIRKESSNHGTSSIK